MPVSGVSWSAEKADAVSGQTGEAAAEGRPGGGSAQHTVLM